MKNILHNVVYHILKPIITIAHKKGLSFDEFGQISKKVFVEVAEESLREVNERPSHSRIAVSTGLTRREVSQLRQTPTEKLMASARSNRGMRVVNGWMTDDDFLDNGAPAVLNLQSGENSFEQLVSLYSGDVPFKAMLKELRLSGVVEELDNDKVVLINEVYIPRGIEEDRLVLMVHDVVELMNTINHNHQSPKEEALFQRKVSYDNLPEAVVDEFKRLSSQKSRQLLVELNKWLANHGVDTEKLPSAHNGMGSDVDALKTNQFRAGLGIYYFEEKPNKEINNVIHKTID